MSSWIIIGIVTGILSGIWAMLSLNIGLVTFAGFLGWSSFFAAGGGTKGLKSALITNFTGVIWGFLMVQMSNFFAVFLGETIGLGLSVAIGACGMSMQSRFKWLGFIPGAFIGANTYFATGLNFGGSVAAMIVGGLFGYVNEKSVNWAAHRKVS
ncbi:DUF1097 domain-containing protein [Paenibacillus sp. D2_2]|uniref:DUF1097 domain-containing protein n=1 Tax=Paenibacillus sp. D2_2 TaxID=3073092 RepID=UPI0028150E1A|nr:DUF1097 domain-containing protein [Paenibacillus sp. D2_2]WMT39589.1 DUF1097 domain-containing protein [Paenibacillus sp. D2_2]